MLCPLAQVCVVYEVKKVCHSWGLSQLMGVTRNRMRTLALLQQQEESCYVETETNSNLFYLKYIPKVLQDPPLKGKERVIKIITIIGCCVSGLITEVSRDTDCWTPSNHRDTFFSIHLVMIIIAYYHYHPAIYMRYTQT